MSEETDWENEPAFGETPKRYCDCKGVVHLCTKIS